MRYVDLDELALPNGWQAKADAALNTLRQEINNAEAAARAAGQDVAAARKTAISKGVKVKAREDIWGELAPLLKALGHRKCWYSESLNPASDKNVDHFRPKAEVEEEKTHEGYWWLAFDWHNFRYASQWCNQIRNDKVNKTRGGKGNRFPLQDGSFRARLETDNYHNEHHLLLDPTDPDDWRLLTFREDGYPTAARPEGTLEHLRAAVSIEVYHLNCKELIDGRKPLAGQVQRLVEEMEHLLPHIATDNRSKSLFKAREKDLLRLIRKTSEYSAAALAYARGQVYKMELGHQVKRDWLEDVLNSQS